MPTDTARKTTKKATSQGHCAQCEALNPYTNITCKACGARLPWADAIDEGREKAKSAGSTAIIIGFLVIAGLVITAATIFVALYAAGLIHLPQLNK
ncbi:MAG: hypothetical protein JO316_23175 [Abitibacteriaceae bacterium]|nr:hypothetical protein [Abditibacteriaceae bacterium]MBV9868267.1 hypothetical protein [Abditibacteriaceae bacterium]